MIYYLWVQRIDKCSVVGRRLQFSLFRWKCLENYYKFLREVFPFKWLRVKIVDIYKR